MEQEKRITKNKGGRPPKAVKRNQPLTVKCTIIEQKAIERKAKEAGLTVSEYLRNMGLTGKIDRRDKVLPKEVLEYNGTLNHVAANLNQIAKKRNSNDELSDLDRQELKDIEKEIKEHIGKVKSYFI